MLNEQKLKQQLNPKQQIRTPVFMRLHLHEFHGGCKSPAALLLLWNGPLLLLKRRCVVRPACSAEKRHNAVYVLTLCTAAHSHALTCEIRFKIRRVVDAPGFSAHCTPPVLWGSVSLSSSQSVSQFGVRVELCFCFIFSLMCPDFMPRCRHDSSGIMLLGLLKCYWYGLVYFCFSFGTTLLSCNEVY